MLQFLQLLFGVLFRGEVKVERIPASRALSPLEISGHVVGTFLSDNLDTALLKKSHGNQNLEKCNSGSSTNGGKGVGFAEVNTIPAAVGECSEKSGPDETNNCKLRDTSMDKFGLTVPLNTIRRECSAETRVLANVDLRVNGDTGEAKWVESKISDIASIKVIWGTFEWESCGSFSRCCLF